MTGVGAAPPGPVAARLSSLRARFRPSPCDELAAATARAGATVHHRRATVRRRSDAEPVSTAAQLVAGGRGGKERAARYERSSDWPRGRSPLPGSRSDLRTVRRGAHDPVELREYESLSVLMCGVVVELRTQVIRVEVDRVKPGGAGAADVVADRVADVEACSGATPSGSSAWRKMSAAGLATPTTPESTIASTGTPRPSPTWQICAAPQLLFDRAVGVADDAQLHGRTPPARRSPSTEPRTRWRHRSTFGPLHSSRRLASACVAPARRQRPRLRRSRPDTRGPRACRSSSARVERPNADVVRPLAACSASSSNTERRQRRADRRRRAAPAARRRRPE